MTKLSNLVQRSRSSQGQFLLAEGYHMGTIGKSATFLPFWPKRILARCRMASRSGGRKVAQDLVKERYVLERDAGNVGF